MKQLVSILAVLALLDGSVLAAESPEAMKCIKLLDKGMFKIAGLQLKEVSGCLKEFAADPVANPDPDGCAFPNLKVQEATTELLEKAEVVCAGPGMPTLGGPDALLSPAIEGATLSASLTSVLIGHYLAGDAVTCSEAPAEDGCKCQNALLGATGKLVASYAKLFHSCKQRGLKDGSIADEVQLAACLSDPAKLDPKSKLTSVVGKLGKAIAKKCPATVTDPLPGGYCSGLNGDALRDCIDDWTRCTLCHAVSGANQIGVDCDVFDDGLDNATCDSNPYD